MPSIRPAAVAGQFYPADATALHAQIAQYLAAARATEQTDETAAAPPKLLIVPHAGYIYSGAVAAHAYALLARWRERIRRVVLLGPVHRVPVHGLVTPRAQAFETPLGRVMIDTAAIAALQDLPQVERDDWPHALEHSLEVQLPFLQSVLADFTLLPLAVGDATPAEVDEVIERLWGGDETLIVVSSDLSHYLPYAQARSRDSATVQRLLAFDGTIDTHDACGAMPIRGALQAARRHALSARLLDLRNSGDTAGDKQRVVGYAALAFDAPATKSDDETLGSALLGAARNAIGQRLGAALLPEIAHVALAQPGATFVTLRDARGELRGCKGRIAPERALLDDVRANALATAFEDCRFPPLAIEEWPGTRIEVSLLGPLTRIHVHTEAQALAALRPGVDGVVFQWRDAQATFLPQVWAELRKPEEFVGALKRKAGLAADFWARDVQLLRYGVRKFVETRDACT
jgi:AmmeMemoRadiSam system protein B/AmmeMemoRadiSam system protein A